MSRRSGELSSLRVLMLQPRGLQGTVFMLPLAEAFQSAGATLVTVEMEGVVEMCRRALSLVGGSYELFLALMEQEVRKTPVDLALSFGGNQFMEEAQTHTIRNFLADLHIPQLAFLTRSFAAVVSFFGRAEALRAANWRGTSLLGTSPAFAPPLQHTPSLTFHCFPPGTNARLFAPPEERPQPEADLVFVGSFTPWRALVLALLTRELSLHVYGEGRFKLLSELAAGWHPPVDYFTALNRVNATACAVLDLPHEPGLDRVSHRVFDAALGGNAVLACRSPLLDACLRPGEQYAAYEAAAADHQSLLPLHVAFGAKAQQGAAFPVEELLQEFPGAAELVRQQAALIVQAFREAGLASEALRRQLGRCAEERVRAEHLWQHRLLKLTAIAQEAARRFVPAETHSPIIEASA